MSFAPPPLGARYDPSTPMARRALVAGVCCFHLLAAWALLQVDSVRQTVSEMAPMMVDLIAAPAPPILPAPPPAAPPKPLTPPPPVPVPVMVALPTTDPPPTAIVLAPAPEPPPPIAEAPSPAPVAAPAPSPPRSIPATAVQYLEPPAPIYPKASRRLGESGRVLVRVEIDTQGRARQVQLSRSSGSQRLDESALAAVRAARFKPYTENGEAMVVWTTVPISFELE